MPKISIILPCYNVEKFVGKSIESVLAQTYEDWELLVIIDGSPDRSVEIAKGFAGKDDRIKVFEKENGGLSDARNYGMERAEGEFIYFMDSDDWIEPDLLEDNLKIVETENLDFVVFGYYQDDEDINGQLKQSRTILPSAERWEKSDPGEIDHHHLGLLGYAWNKLYRRAYLEQYQFRFDKGISLVEDILFNAKVYTQASVIRFNRKAYYHYMNRPVVTLMKTFHPEYLTWKKKKNKALELFFNEWKFENRAEVLANNYINGFRESLHSLFAYKNQLNEKEKRAYIREMYNDELTKERLRDYKTYHIKDRIHYFLIKNNCIFATWFFAKMIK